MTRTMTNREMAATHEAGHCTAAEVFNVPVMSAEIRPDSGGKTNFYRPALEAASVKAQAIIYAAGPEAALRAVGEARAWQAENSDQAAIDSITRRTIWGGSDGLREIRACAANLAHDHQIKIQLIANALLERGFLSGDQVRTIAGFAPRTGMNCTTSLYSTKAAATPAKPSPELKKKLDEFFAVPKEQRAHWPGCVCAAAFHLFWDFENDDRPKIPYAALDLGALKALGLPTDDKICADLVKEVPDKRKLLEVIGIADQWAESKKGCIRVVAEYLRDRTNAGEEIPGRPDCYGIIRAHNARQLAQAY